MVILLPNVCSDGDAIRFWGKTYRLNPAPELQLCAFAAIRPLDRIVQR
ncbi:MAG: hypothetical protein WAK11_13170 [Candidatus Cybelea sp.]